MIDEKQILRLRKKAEWDLGAWEERRKLSGRRYRSEKLIAWTQGYIAALDEVMGQLDNPKMK